jgi:hypothetical protein
MEQTLGTRLGTAIGAGIDAIVDGFGKIGHDLQLDVLAKQALEGARAAGSGIKEGWTEWHDVQPITSTTVATAAAATSVLAAFAGKRGLMLALTGSALVGPLLLPILIVELMQAEEALRSRQNAKA